MIIKRKHSAYVKTKILIMTLCMTALLILNREVVCADQDVDLQVVQVRAICEDLNDASPFYEYEADVYSEAMEYENYTIEKLKDNWNTPIQLNFDNGQEIKIQGKNIVFGEKARVADWEVMIVDKHFNKEIARILPPLQVVR